ncbi:Uncharacterised protein [uncultured archaeon]|nr:Uncharacterised protein [uncultured archaeon]
MYPEAVPDAVKFKPLFIIACDRRDFYSFSLAFVEFYADYQLLYFVFSLFLFIAACADFRDERDFPILRDQYFPAAAVYRGPRGDDHSVMFLIFPLHVQSAYYSPAVDKPVDKPPLFIEVALLGEVVPDCHQFPVVIVVSLERKPEETTRSFILFFHIFILHKLN